MPSRLFSRISILLFCLTLGFALLACESKDEEAEQGSESSESEGADPAGGSRNEAVSGEPGGASAGARATAEFATPPASGERREISELGISLVLPPEADVSMVANVAQVSVPLSSDMTTFLSIGSDGLKPSSQKTFVAQMAKRTNREVEWVHTSESTLVWKETGPDGEAVWDVYHRHESNVTCQTNPTDEAGAPQLLAICKTIQVSE